MKQVQGAVNNLRGIRAELVAAEVLPEVVAVSKRFYSRPEEGRVSPPCPSSPFTHMQKTKVFYRIVV
jgi:hypothetical protein